MCCRFWMDRLQKVRTAGGEDVVRGVGFSGGDGETGAWLWPCLTLESESLCLSTSVCSQLRRLCAALSWLGALYGLAAQGQSWPYAAHYNPVKITLWVCFRWSEHGAEKQLHLESAAVQGAVQKMEGCQRDRGSKKYLMFAGISVKDRIYSLQHVKICFKVIHEILLEICKLPQENVIYFFILQTYVGL